MTLLDDLTRDEGYRAGPYRDSLGIWTVGIGRNVEANPLMGAEWKTLLDANEITVSLSKAGAERLLRTGIANAESLCATAFAWWPTLDNVRRAVLVNLCFNMGLSRLMGFRLMLDAINRGDYETAADELTDSRWFRQVGARGPRLTQQLRTGVRP